MNIENFDLIHRKWGLFHKDEKLRPRESWGSKKAILGQIWESAKNYFRVNQGKIDYT